MWKWVDSFKSMLLGEHSEVGDIEEDEFENENMVDDDEEVSQEDEPVKTDWLNKDVKKNNQPNKILIDAFIARPIDMEGAQFICDELKKGNICTINLEDADSEMKQRIADLISGVVYAKDGNIKNVSDNVIMATPASVPITDGMIREVKKKSYDFRGSRRYGS
jgi:FtsZ-interacting cell division protein YlmF